MDKVTVLYVDEASAVYVGTELIGVEAFGDLFDDVTAEVLGKRFGFEVESHDFVGEGAPFDVYDENEWPKFLPDALRALGNAKAKPVNESPYLDAERTKGPAVDDIAYIDDDGDAVYGDGEDWE